jgi:hypothetical protein
VDVALVQTGCGDLNEVPVLSQFRQISTSAVAHPLAQSGYELVEVRFKLPLVGHAPLHSFRYRFFTVGDTVSFRATLFHRRERPHTAIRLEDPPFEEELFSRSFLEAREKTPDHHGVRAGGDCLGDVSGILDSSVGDDRNAVLTGNFHGIEYGGELRNSDSGHDPGGADRTGPHSDLDNVRSGIDQSLSTLAGGNIAGYDRYIRIVAFDSPDRFHDVQRISVGRIDHEEINLGFHQQRQAHLYINRRDGSSYNQTAGTVGGGVGKLAMFLHVLYRNETGESSLAVDDGQFFDLELVELRFGAGDIRRPDLHDRIPSHDVLYEPAVVRSETEIATGDYTHKSSLFDHRQSGNAVEIDDLPGFTDRLVRSYRDRILDDPVEVAFDGCNLRSLRFGGHITVYDAGATLQGKCYCEFVLRDGIHRGRNDRHVQVYARREIDPDVGVARQDARESRLKENVVITVFLRKCCCGVGGIDGVHTAVCRKTPPVVHLWRVWHNKRVNRYRKHSAVIASLAMAGIFSIWSCDAGVDYEYSRPTGTHIRPSASQGIVLARAETRSVSIQADDEEQIASRVVLGDDYTLLATYNVSLDMDETDEQIIVAKRHDDPDDLVRLLVADFDPLRNTYRTTWEGATSATGIRSFAVYTIDAIGDHQEEIVGVGTDNEGHQTINIFRRRNIEAGGAELSYREIFRNASDGSIEIVESRRSDAYRTLRTTGESFPVVVFRRNEDSDDPLDLIREEYRWSAEQEQYVLYSESGVASGEIEQEQLRELYDAGTAAVEDFLSGPWFRSTGDNIGSSVELAFFDPGRNELSLLQTDTQERYQWLNSYKTLYRDGPGLWINLRNDVLRTVRKQLSVTILGLDTIRISVEGAEYWNGRYQRMTTGIQESVIRRYETGRPDFSLRGVYRNESGDEILFDEPYFRFRTGSFDWSGGFNVIALNKPVLELKVTNAEEDGGDDREYRTPVRNGAFNARYTIDYSEQQSEDRIIRRMVLSPVRLTVDAIHAIDGDPIVLEQVEEFLIDD